MDGSPSGENVGTFQDGTLCPEHGCDFPLEDYLESSSSDSVSWEDDPTPITRVTGPGGTATGSVSATINTNTSMSINNSQFVSSFIQAY